MTERDTMILSLQIAIINQAKRDGWHVRRLNNRQIEIVRKHNENIDYNQICRQLLITSCELCKNI